MGMHKILFSLSSLMKAFTKRTNVDRTCLRPIWAFVWTCRRG